ncbi:hypothetical protein RRG08_001816 [Elysia crispata]|uniref:Uncharacterized protein n=1 Tax=Elysia crispata TaxID=231223 RepID=A0AAE1CTU1_9GAST|nr:hypothetical protein RRG08_001816 [Elysia crispata]
MEVPAVYTSTRLFNWVRVSGKRAVSEQAAMCAALLEIREDTTRNYRYSSSLRETCSLILNQKRPVIIVGSIKIGQTVPANFNTSKQLCWQEAETQGRNYNQGVLWVSS